MENRENAITLRLPQVEVDLIDRAGEAFGLSRAQFMVAASLCLVRVLADMLAEKERTGDHRRVAVGESGIRGAKRRRFNVKMTDANLESVDWAVSLIAGANRVTFMRAAALSAAAQAFVSFGIDPRTGKERDLVARWEKMQPIVDLCAALRKAPARRRQRAFAGDVGP